MPTARPALIDADGHLIESLEEMAEFLEPSVRRSAQGLEGTGIIMQLNRTSLFGTLDGLHFPRIQKEREGKQTKRPRVNASEHRMGSAEDWVAFLDKSEMDQTVLYTTEGLQVGLLRNPEYATSVCRSYNDYVASTYAQKDPRIHPIALIPMQDPKAAATELRRCVKELGLIGAMLPSTGLPMHLGHEYYWPIYDEAADLGCILGVHGGSNRNLGLDTFTNLTASHMLHHPVPLLYAFASFVYDGVFDRVPDLKVAFLEGGCAWVPLLLDRAAREAEFGQASKRPFPEYFTGGQILIGCEGVDPSLPYLAKRLGIEPFAYSSDYPHEVDFQAAMHEIDETLEVPELSGAEKAAVLGGNAKRFFGF
jgi:hypothetical protein